MLCDVLTYNIHGLPWSKPMNQEICDFLERIRPSIVCLQEAFVPSVRLFYKHALERIGYRVFLPHDGEVSWLNSGLLIAVWDTEWQLESECFCPYLDVHNVEWFSNKGFYLLRLRNKETRQCLELINTHTQSDTELPWIFGRKTSHNVRKKQATQLVDFVRRRIDSTMTLVIGDLNCETSPHADLCFLHPPSESSLPLKKATFYSTGEDLDHVAYVKGTCAVVPRIARCRIYDVPYSDHAPVHYRVEL